jgi:ribosome-associated toxin RatA of RatAB toxin-antitoxin module
MRAMRSIRRTALVGRPAAQMFDLIEGAEHYPAFLPWCHDATIVSRDDAVVSADIDIRWRGLHLRFRTRNPKQRPEYMAIHLEQGPFRHFFGEWRLRPLAADACKVEFALDYEFESRIATHAAGPVFDRIADRLVDAFVERALAAPVAAAPADALSSEGGPSASPAVAVPGDAPPAG